MDKKMTQIAAVPMLLFICIYTVLIVCHYTIKYSVIIIVATVKYIKNETKKRNKK